MIKITNHIGQIAAAMICDITEEQLYTIIGLCIICIVLLYMIFRVIAVTKQAEILKIKL